MIKHHLAFSLHQGQSEHIEYIQIKVNRKDTNEKTKEKIFEVVKCSLTLIGVTFESNYDSDTVGM